MKYKFNPLTGEFNIVPDSGTLIQKLNWLTGNFNLTKDASKYKQIYNAIEGEFNLRPATTQIVVHGVGSVQLTNAAKNGLLSLKAYGGTEQRNLPKGYTQLEYVVFDSTQMIDTGFIPDNNSRIESKCYRTGEDCWFYGASPSNPRVTLYHSRTGTCRWGNQSISNSGFVADTEYTIIEDKNGLTINGTLYPWVSGTAGDFTCDRSLTIGNNNGSTGTRYFAGNFYYMKIYDNDVLVRNFVPCKNSSNVVGMYDTVNGVFYTATGLVAGTTVVPTPTAPMDIVSNNGILKVRKPSGLPLGYTLLEYIESSGTQYIDTGMKPDQDCELDFNFQYYQWSDITTSGRVLGSRYTNNNRHAIAFGANSGRVKEGDTWFTQFYEGNETATNTTATHDLLVWHHVNLKSGQLTFDDTTKSMSSAGTFTTPYNMVLFGFMQSTSTATEGTFGGGFVRIREYKVTKNGAIIQHLVSAKNSSNAIGMYDLVSGQFFTNSGTGNFTAGNVVSDPIEIYADGTTEKIGLSLAYSAVDGQGTFVSPSDVNTTRIYKAFGKLAAGTYTVEIDGPFEFIMQYKDKIDTTPTQYGNIDTWTKTGEYEITDDTMYYGVAIRNDSGTGNITPSAFVSGNGRISIKKSDDNVVAEMLLKIGDYVDEQEILSGNITRKVGIKVLDGTENWSLLNQANYVYGININDAAGQSSWTEIGGICTHLVWYTGSTPTYTNTPANSLWFNANRDLRVKTNSNFETLNAWKKYLKDQYDAGTPVIVIYPLATPTTETVAGQTMNIPSGDSTIEITQASIDNLELEATYEQDV